MKKLGYRIKLKFLNEAKTKINGFHKENKKNTIEGLSNQYF